MNYMTNPQAGQDAGADGLLISFETKFLMALRQPGAMAAWPERFAYKPPGPVPTRLLRFPINLTAFGMREFTGKWEFRNANSGLYIDLANKPYHDGAELDVNSLRGGDRAATLIGWDQTTAGMIDSYMWMVAPELYSLLSAGKTTGTVWTGGANFFATDHKVNPKQGFGTFWNLVNGGGSKAETPVYLVLRGGSFNNLYPWTIITGEGLGPAMAAAGGAGVAPAAGEPWILRWDTSHPSFVDSGFKIRTAIYCERGWGLLFPHKIIRLEGDLTYANLKAGLDAARNMKDLNGRMGAQDIGVDILCEPGDVSTINELLGRDVTNVGASSPSNAQSAIDPVLKAAEIIPLGR